MAGKAALFPAAGAAAPGVPAAGRLRFVPVGKTGQPGPADGHRHVLSHGGVRPAGRRQPRRRDDAGTGRHGTHDWEPRPSDLGRIAGSALFLYNGGVETWVPQALEAIGVGKAHALEVGRGLIRQDDPHVWNSPRQAMAEVRVIRDELIRLDPSHQTDYEHNAAAYLQKLGALDKELSRVAATAKRKEFVTTHAAFGYIARDYGLVQIPVMGINPESEPSPADMARLVRLMKEKQIRYIAFETLVSPKVAETLANSTGAQTYVLNPLEGLTKEERDRGDDFVTVLARNIRSLQTALNE
jgi:zinc transport system substrate-binding protein